jgi:hypothetical protein
MKPGKLLIMVLVFVLGTAVAAPANTLHTPWQSCHQEQALYQILRAWGFSLDSEALQHATPLETLPAGSYVIKHYASDLDRSQSLGIYPSTATSPGHGARAPVDAIQLLTARHSGNWECQIAFAETSDFAFYDAIKKPTTLLTTQNQNSTSRHHHPSGGLIFDLGELNPLYAGQYIIAFEDGRKCHPCGNLNYNDLVVHVCSAPLPATLPLLGGGLLGLLIRRWRQKLFASAA